MKIDIDDVTIDAENEDEDPEFYAFYQDQQVGEASTFVDEGRLKLCNLLVEPEFRGSGVASLLLGRVLAYARALPCTEVYGLVTEDDLKRTTGLLKWYERKGFVVTPSTEPPKPGQPRAISLISMRLEPN